MAMFLKRPGFPALAVGCMAIFTAAACSRDASPTTPAAMDAPSAAKAETGARTSNTKAPLMSGEWRLVAIDHRVLSAGGNPTVVFGDEGNCWGSTGVNNFRTSFKLDGATSGRFELGTAAVTRKAGPPEAMALEGLFLERLQSARAFELEGNQLHLSSGEDQYLTFERVLH